jgi:putative tryptophan/tyrosine transport system substrate-binding protein
MRRREFIKAVGGAAAAWPLVARGQPATMRRVGVLIGTTESDPETKRRVEGLVQGLREADWIEGRNIHLDYRFSGADPDRMRRYAAEIVALAPHVIVVHSNDYVAALRQADRAIPTIFAQVGDPVGSGFVESLARPGGNLTGFTTFEPGIGGKWLQTLKEIAPGVTRTLVLLDAKIAANLEYLHAAETAASKIGLTVTAGPVQNASEIEHSITTFADGPNGGLLVLPSPTTGVNRKRIIGLATQFRLPAVYAFRFFATSGGLVSYGVDTADLYRRAASYVDRILKGAKPADLPVQQPTKFELVINLNSAKAIGLEIPPTLLARADQVIE